MKAAGRAQRIIHVLRIAILHIILHGLHKLLKRWPGLATKLAGQNLSGPERLRAAIEDIGGTFIKFGQVMAMQSDLLPLQYCKVLFTLFDQVAPFDYAEVERVFEEDLGQTPLQIFNSFDRTPIATGSIGQVHVATLNTIKVAVKIRRPTIVSDFAADIASMKFAVGMVKLLHIKWLYWIIAPTEEFVAWTQDELDFRREAHYIVELGRNAQENRFEKVPKVFWSCTTARILTAEFLDGITLAEYLRMLDSGCSPQVPPEFDKDLFAARLIDNFLGDAFRHGMFHADLHPGNLMILRGNVIGYIDFGISGVLSRYSRRHLIAMTLAYARGDLDKMCDAFFCISTLAKNADVHGFRVGVKKASAAWYGHGSGQTRLRKSITSIMLDLLILSKNNGVWPQRDVIKYIRSAIALDGLIKTFSPGADIGLHLEKACERHIKWDSFRALTSSDLAVGSFAATTRLAGDGFLRAYAMLNHFASEKPLGAAGNGDARGPEQARQPLQLVWIIFCLSLPALLGSGRMSTSLLHPSGMLATAAISIVLWRAVRSMRFA